MANPHSAFEQLALEPGAIRTQVRGFPVILLNTRPDISTEYVLVRLERALALIESFAPRRYRRLQHDLAGFWVQRFACRGAFFAEAGACLTELTFLAHPEITLPEIAASIVHEGTHARVARAGIGQCTNRHAREERLCRESELEFGRAVPGGEPVVTRALASLSLSDAEVAPAIDWGEAERRVQEVDRADLRARKPQ